MQRFFKDFESIDQFTLSLDYHQDKLECVHCSKHDQFVSHGIVYKQRSIAIKEPVGKRIFCSNRYGRSGCGRTFQLYIASEIPHFRYGAAHLFVFISCLLANLTIHESYQQASGPFESRHAWRWLNKLMAKLGDYRTFLKKRIESLTSYFIPRTQQLKHLLPTLKRLLSNNLDCPLCHYQFAQQKALI